MTPQVFVEAVVTGLQVGCIYALIALGLSLIFGIIRVINFAHGSMAVFFMYLGYILWKLWGINPYISIVIVAPIAFAFGFGVHHFLIRPLFVREKSYVIEPIGVLILMAGFDMVLSNAIMMVFKPFVRTVVLPFSPLRISVGSLTLILTLPHLIITGICVALVFGLSWLLNHTELGNVIRAVGQNREAAALCGVNVYRIHAITFGIGCAVTAVGGCAMIPFISLLPAMGLGLAIKSFIIVVLGGLGSITGVLIAGIIIGMLEVIVGQFIPASTAVIVSLIVFLVVLYFKPKGLRGVIEV